MLSVNEKRTIMNNYTEFMVVGATSSAILKATKVKPRIILLYSSTMVLMMSVFMLRLILFLQQLMMIKIVMST